MGKILKLGISIHEYFRIKRDAKIGNIIKNLCLRKNWDELFILLCSMQFVGFYDQSSPPGLHESFLLLVNAQKHGFD